MGAISTELLIRQVTALCSCFGSFLILLTYKISPRWAEEFRDSKNMLLWLSVYNIFASIGFYLQPSSDNDGFECRLQASLIQYFSIGSAMYDACLALETKFQINDNLSGQFRDEEGGAMKFRHKCFHGFIVIFGLAIVIWMNSNANLYIGQQFFRGDRSESLCWIKDDLLLFLFVVVPVWIATLIITYCNVSIVYSLYAALNPTNGSLVIKLSSSTKMILIRLSAIPVIFIFLWFPTTLIRTVAITSAHLSHLAVNSFNILYACTVASAGIFNVIFYIFLDASVRKRWILVCCTLFRLRSLDELELTSFALKSSTSDNDGKKDNFDSSLFRPSSMTSRPSIIEMQRNASDVDSGSNGVSRILSVASTSSIMSGSSVGRAIPIRTIPPSILSTTGNVTSPMQDNKSALDRAMATMAGSIGSGDSLAYNHPISNLTIGLASDSGVAEIT